MKGLGRQDCALQGWMGPIADRAAEYLLASDAAIVKIRSLLLQTLKDHAAGTPLPGMRATRYRVRSARCEAPKGQPISVMIARHVRLAPAAAASPGTAPT